MDLTHDSVQYRTGTHATATLESAA
jgi:hypothetical protein